MSNSNTLEEFELLINQNTGSKLEYVIINLMESNIINIERLVQHPNIQSLKDNKVYQTLLLVSRGNLNKYLENKDRYIDLSPKLLLKLKKVTFLEIISKSKQVDFAYLSKELQFDNDFALNQFLFDCFTSQLFKGKIDQKSKILKVIEVKPRDYISDWNEASNKLKSWIERIEKYESYLDSQNKDIKCCNDCYTKMLIEKETKILEKNKI